MSCNLLKRNRCQDCKISNKRFDATTLYPNASGWLEGNCNYNDNLGCRGCYLYDIGKFQSSLTFRKIK